MVQQIKSRIQEPEMKEKEQVTVDFFLSQLYSCKYSGAGESTYVNFQWLGNPKIHASFYCSWVLVSFLTPWTHV